jgi:hypothetical protein
MNTGDGTGDGTNAARAAPSGNRGYWMNTVSLDHVEAAAIGGFTQANHGANTRLKLPRRGDEMIFYSPRTELSGGTPVRQFTAWATITGDEPYQAHVSDDFHPWRLAADFHTSHPVGARELVDQLSFVTDPAHWGLPFRRGLFQIPRQDFETIIAHMTR